MSARRKCRSLRSGFPTAHVTHLPRGKHGLTSLVTFEPFRSRVKRAKMVVVGENGSRRGRGCMVRENDSDADMVDGSLQLTQLHR